MIENDPLHDFGMDETLAGTGVFGAGVPTNLTRGDNGWTHVLLTIRATTLPPVAVSRAAIRNNNLINGTTSNFRVNYLSYATILFQVDPLQNINLTLVVALGYDVAGCVVRGFPSGRVIEWVDSN